MSEYEGDPIADIYRELRAIRSMLDNEIKPALLQAGFWVPFSKQTPGDKYPETLSAGGIDRSEAEGEGAGQPQVTGAGLETRPGFLKGISPQSQAPALGYDPDPTQLAQLASSMARAIFEF